jgi:hypothetical protein
MAKARAKGRLIAPLELSAEEAAPARRSYLGQAPASRHPCLHRPLQPKPQALQMDQVRPSNIGFGEALLPEDTEDIMQRTLDSRD